MNTQSNCSKAFSRNSKSQQSMVSEHDNIKRYQLVDKCERQTQRQKVHKNVVKKQKQADKKRQKFLLAELAKKRQELMKLQQAQATGEVNQEAEAHNNAKVKLEKQRIKKMEKELQKQQFIRSAKQREKQALKWLQDQHKVVHKQEIQAQKLRQTHYMRQQKQRDQTHRFAKSLLLKKQKQEITMKKQTEKDVKHYIKAINTHGVHKRPPNSQSQTHFVVSKENEEENTAMRQAEEAKKKNRHIQKLKAQENERNREKAVLRGQQALAKMKEQRQFQDYLQETTQEQKNYNMGRIAAGKRNQYTGVKPMTLSQIQMNKKQRGEVEFEQMLFKGKKVSSNSQTLASRYTVFEKKMKENKIVQVKPKPKPKQPINYMDQESLINNVSEGHYSFEQDKEWKEEEIPHESQEEEHYSPAKIEEIHEEQQASYPRPIMKDTVLSKDNMKETRIPNQSRRHELNYSRSQEESMSQD